LVAAAEAMALGYWGIAVVPRAKGVAFSRIRRGMVELRPRVLEAGRVRRPGARRKRLSLLPLLVTRGFSP
jgi:hypothetical protein